MLTVTTPTVDEPFVAKLVAFTSAATLDLPVAVRAENAAAATRDDKVDGGEPVSVAPLTRLSVPAAARPATYSSKEAAAVVPAPADAAATAAAVEPEGLAS